MLSEVEKQNIANAAMNTVTIAMLEVLAEKVGIDFKSIYNTCIDKCCEMIIEEMVSKLEKVEEDEASSLLYRALGIDNKEKANEVKVFLDQMKIK